MKQKRIFLLLLFTCINVLAFSQNSNLHFKNGLTAEKKENFQPKRNVSENQSYIEINYNFENADVFDIKQDTNQFQLLKVKVFCYNGRCRKTSTSQL